MGQEMDKAHPSAVERVRKRIEHWRRTRVRRTAMPEELWSAALALVGEHGLYRVARALRVDYAALKLRLVQAGAAPSDRAGFIELHAQVFGASEAAGAVVELWRADGARMAVQLPPGYGLDPVGLVRAFCGRAA